ncbi:MAG: hypothetical protein ABSF32_08410 [Ignavibacteria bacterium]
MLEGLPREYHNLFKSGNQTITKMKRRLTIWLVILTTYKIRNMRIQTW